MTDEQSALRLEKWIRETGPPKMVFAVRKHLGEHCVLDEIFKLANAWIRCMEPEDPLRRKMIKLIFYREGFDRGLDFFDRLAEELTDDELKLARQTALDANADRYAAHERGEDEPQAWDNFCIEF